MALSPPPLSRSPASSLNTDLPSPDLGDTHYKLAALYQQACGMDHHLDSEPLSLDAASSAEWHATLLHPATTTTTTTTTDGPNMLAAPYDAFHNGYDNPLQPEYPHNMYTTVHPHHSLSPQPYSRALSHSPAMAQRHFYSYRPSGSPQPRVKMENSSDYPDPEISRYPSPHAGPSMAADVGSYSSAASSSGYLSDAPSSSMAGHEYTHLDNASFASISGAPSHAHSGSNTIPYRVARPTRTKMRKLTTKEDANYQCEVPGCGKLFSRSYNYKAHMATHDENREYPFPCTVGDCNKKFVRKTDLTRHHQSVHMREKNHRCDYCSRSFARRDTLRRHMEDGCAKRFDIGTMDVRSDGYDSSFGSRPASHLLAPPTQLPPMTNSRPRSPNSNLLEPSISLMRRGY